MLTGEAIDFVLVQRYEGKTAAAHEKELAEVSAAVRDAKEVKSFINALLKKIQSKEGVALIAFATGIAVGRRLQPPAED